MALGFDSSGEPLAVDDDGNTWSPVMLFSKADSEKRVEWGMKSYNTHEMCPDCVANHGDDFPYTDLRDTASWKPSSEMNNEDWCDRNQSDHPIQSSRYWSKYFWPIDIMHCLDLHGVTAVFIASIYIYIDRC